MNSRPGWIHSPSWKFLLILTAACFLPAGAASSETVKMWEEPKTIPTYRAKKPEKAPMFYHGRAYQGAEGHIYPYAFRDQLTNKRVKKEYKAVYLENKYVKICVLPDIGGRVLRFW